jgi:hypothetical protein
MQRRQNPQYKRPTSFDRPAFRADLERLEYARIPKAVCHQWARPILEDLSPAANKVLSLLVSLAMCGKKGYPGLAEPDAYACKVVRKITDQKCQISTWRNGRRELVKKGLVSRTYWTRPDQRIQNGSRVVVVPGGQRVHKQGDEWCTKQIRITLLTPAGAGLFDRKTRMEKSRILALLPTPLKSSARPQIEDRGGISKEDSPPSLVRTSSTKDVPQLPIDRRFPREQGAEQDSEGLASEGLEGKPTRPPRPTPSAGATLEHGHDEPPAVEGGRASSKPGSKGSFEGSSAFSNGRGVSSKRPTVPRGGGRKGKEYAKARFLSVLHQCLANYPTKEADRIWTRAQTELEISAIENWPTVINARYWLSRAPHLTRREFFGFMRSRIIPGLRFGDIVFPKERKNYQVWKERAPISGKLTIPVQELPGFLKSAAQKFCLE